MDLKRQTYALVCALALAGCAGGDPPVVRPSGGMTDGVSAWDSGIMEEFVFIPDRKNASGSDPGNYELFGEFPWRIGRVVAVSARGMTGNLLFNGSEVVQTLRCGDELSYVVWYFDGEPAVAEPDVSVYLEHSEETCHESHT